MRLGGDGRRRAIPAFGPEPARSPAVVGNLGAGISDGFKSPGSTPHGSLVLTDASRPCAKRSDGIPQRILEAETGVCYTLPAASVASVAQLVEQLIRNQ